MSYKICTICEKRDRCRTPCADIEAQLRDLVVNEWSDTTSISGDYIDRKFATVEEEAQDDELLKRKSWERRIVYSRMMIRIFERFKNKSLKYLLIWRYHIEENLTQQQIAELVDYSQQQVGNIIKRLENLCK